MAIIPSVLFVEKTSVMRLSLFAGGTKSWEKVSKMEMNRKTSKSSPFKKVSAGYRPGRFLFREDLGIWQKYVSRAFSLNNKFDNFSAYNND
jgi:hypothetical protein